MNRRKRLLNRLWNITSNPIFIRLHYSIHLKSFLDKEGLQRYPVHIELETGMNRLGFGIK
jgi:alanine racemase